MRGRNKKLNTKPRPRTGAFPGQLVKRTATTRDLPTWSSNNTRYLVPIFKFETGETYKVSTPVKIPLRVLNLISRYPFNVEWTDAGK